MQSQKSDSPENFKEIPKLPSELRKISHGKGHSEMLCDPSLKGSAILASQVVQV